MTLAYVTLALQQRKVAAIRHASTIATTTAKKSQILSKVAFGGAFGASGFGQGQVAQRRFFSNDSEASSSDNTSTNHGTLNLPPIKLYQYAICPFCNMVKAVLDYSSVQYQTVEVNPLTKAEIKWSKDYKKVPIAEVNEDEVVKGSDKIIDYALSHSDVISFLETNKWNKSSDMTKSKFIDSSDSKQWSNFASETLAPLLYPNICSTYSNSLRTFDYIHKYQDEFSTIQRYSIQYVGAVAMHFAASKIKKRLKIENEQDALKEALDQLETDGLDNGNKTFLSGSNEHPDLGDLAIFGTLRSIQGLPTHTRIIYDNDSAVIPEWYQRMEKQVTSK